MRTVVEESAIPKLVATFAALVEVEVVCSVEQVQPIKYVFAGVRVNDVEKDSDTHPVRSVDELLEL